MGRLHLAIGLSVTLVWALSSPAAGLVRQCYRDTDAVREKALKDLPRVKQFLEEHIHVNGRVGDVKFVNWQDPVFTLNFDNKRLCTGCKTNSKCAWRMSSPYKEEAHKFNSKAYIGNSLHSDPMNARSAYRTLSCEREDCVQFFNVFVRPLPKPDFPIQIYIGNDEKVTCSLNYMDNKQFKFDLKYQNAPFVFEWTGPMNCKKEDFYSTDSVKCARYRVFNSCEGRGDCTRSLLGYEDTDLFVKTGKVQTIDKHGNVKKVHSEKWSQLVINKANEDHDGLWRCIVYDSLGISSEPDEKERKMIEEEGTFQHSGIVNIHCKDYSEAIGYPLAVIFLLMIFIAICMVLPKSMQCTDFEEEEKEEDSEDKKSNKSVNKSKSVDKMAERTNSAHSSVRISSQHKSDRHRHSGTQSLHSSLHQSQSKDNKESLMRTASRH